MPALPSQFKDYVQVRVYMPSATFFSPRMNKIWHWCSVNCEAKFDALFDDDGGYRIWIFKSAEDASFFSLVWKS